MLGQKDTHIIIAILVGAVIIGGFVFAGLTQMPTPQIITIKNTSAAVENSIDTKEALPPPPPPAQSTRQCGADSNTVITKVIDGDTVIVEGGFHVRLLGIDADEKNYPCYNAAKNRLEELILDKQVKLEKDITDIDQYGRCLRTIFVGGNNVDVQLVQEGLAVARFYAPDVKYKAEITVAEKQAIAGNIGCKWSYHNANMQMKSQ